MHQVIDMGDPDIEVLPQANDVPESTMGAEKSPEEKTKSWQKDTEEEKDGVAELIGNFGRWQLKLTFLLSIFNLPCTFHIFSNTFQMQSPPYWCARPSALSHLSVEDWTNLSHPLLSATGGAKYDACNIYDLNYSSLAEDLAGEDISDLRNTTTALIPCTKWEFDTSELGETIISQWSLVCGQAMWTNIAEMTFLAGVALGGLAGGILSDRCGRKRVLFGCLALQIGLGSCIAITPWMSLYMVLKCFLGFFSVSIVFSGFVLCMELVGGKWRTISGVSYLFPTSCSYVLMAGIGYMIRGWRQLQLAITLPAIALFFFWWMIPESPRWLLTMGHKTDAWRIIEKAAKANKLALPEGAQKQLQIKSSLINEGDSVGVLDLFRTPAIRQNTLVLFVIWFSTYLIYYGLVLNMNNLGGNVYVNSAISGLVELPALAASILVLLKLGRRLPLCLTLCGGSIACLITTILPSGSPEWVTTALAMAGKFAVSGSNAILPVFTAELFPTVVRNLGVGASNVPAGIALVLVPYLWNLQLLAEIVPMGVLGTCGMIGGLSVLLLAETAGSPLPGTIEEGEILAKEHKAEKKLKRQEKKSGSSTTVRHPSAT